MAKNNIFDSEDDDRYIEVDKEDSGVRIEIFDEFECSQMHITLDSSCVKELIEKLKTTLPDNPDNINHS